MKKGVEYTGVVTKIAFPNKGEVDCGEDGIASVKGTLPGQKVKFVVSKKRSAHTQRQSTRTAALKRMMRADILSLFPKQVFLLKRTRHQSFILPLGAQATILMQR